MSEREGEISRTALKPSSMDIFALTGLGEPKCCVGHLKSTFRGGIKGGILT
jgi:hypothetical protein